MGQSLAQVFLVIVVSLGLSIAVFLILRALMLWYWKINQILETLNKIEENTKNK
jgi:hypothetical protein